MPVAAWPSFHWRPSTASTLLSPSASMRQTPTTFTNELASAPTVSFEKSSLSGSAADACSAEAVKATAANDRLVMILVMTHLLGRLATFVAGGGSTTMRARSAAAARQRTTAERAPHWRPADSPDSPRRRRASAAGFGQDRKAAAG